ncbi:DMT family transporter [Halosegnis longus]|uniref:EamA/RhaT family transporter n=1 Tax=Halosegnis longus TaxID=2216012 RepID=A0AAJ4R7N1_9EURY|nr:EamA family transporter [Halosegnis longus]RNJ25782.1 EamA/RhaT family transporter [Salella cibi]
MRHRNLLLFATLAAVWGSAFVAIKAGLGTPDAPAGFFETPVLFAALRFDIAGVVMLAYAAVATDRLVPEGRREWASVVSTAVLIITLYHALLFVGETDPAVSSAAAAIVVSLSPVLTAGFSRLLLPSERLTPLGVAGLLLGFVGVAILAVEDPRRLTVAPGLVAVFFAVVAFAAGSVVNRRLDAALPDASLEAWAMVIGAGLLHVGSVAVGESVADVAVTPRSVGALLFLSLAASAVGFLIYFDLLARLGPVEINLVSYAAPVATAVVGFLFLGEIIDARTVVGFAVILAGFLLVKRRAVATALG